MVADRADVERRAFVRPLPSQSAEARVINAPRAQRVAVWRFSEFELVALAYVHLIEDVGGRATLALCCDSEKQGVSPVARMIAEWSLSPVQEVAVKFGSGVSVSQLVPVQMSYD